MSSPLQDGLYHLPSDSGLGRWTRLFQALAAVACAFTLAFWVTSQYVANALFGHHPNLGTPLYSHGAGDGPRWILTAAAFLALVFAAALTPALRPLRLPFLVAAAVSLTAAHQPLWSPLLLPRLLWRHRDTPLYDRLAETYTVFFPTFAGGLILFALFYAPPRQRRVGNATGDTHGSAHFASSDEIREAQLTTKPGGVVVGALDDGRLLYDHHDRHVCLIAPSGTGKSTSFIIPTLLECPDNCLVWDIKAELFEATARHRETTFGHQVLRFDPSDPTGTSVNFNPLLFIHPDDEIADAYRLAAVLVDPEGRHDRLDFWQSSAQELLAATVLHVLYAEAPKDLAQCANLLSHPNKTIEQVLARMACTQHDPSRPWAVDGTPTPHHPEVRRVANALLALPGQTRGGIVQNARSYLQLYRDPVVRRNTSDLDFLPQDLVEKPVTLYITISPARFRPLKPLIRVLFQQLSRALTHEIQPDRRRLRLILDEFTSLGRLDFFGEQIAYLRGYNILAYLACQTTSQLQAVYGREESIRANCALQIIGGPAGDVDTAQNLSRQLGQATVRYSKESLSGGRGPLGLTRATVSPQDIARALLTPDELLRLPPDRTVVLPAGHAPIWATKRPFFSSSRYRSLVKDPALRQRRSLSTHHAWTTTAAAPEWPDIDDYLHDFGRIRRRKVHQKTHSPSHPSPSELEQLELLPPSPL